MFRHRLRGGHKVGAPNNVTRSLPDQTNLSQQTGNLAGPQSQYGASMQPPPQSGPTMDARQVGQQQQQQTGNNNWAWGGGSSDGAWNWGDSAAWSLKNTNQTTNQHQQLIQQQQQPVLSQQLHQQPPQQYNQHHAYSHLQHTSQQQFPEAVQDVTYSNPHATSTTSTTFHQGHVPTNIPLQPQFQQYVNGDSQNGQGTDEWGADNWGDDWGNTESYNNNNNNIPANYVKEENRQKQHQDYHSYPHQEEEEKEQQQVHHGYQQQQEHQHQEYHHQQQYFQPHQQEHEHQQQSPPDACQQQIEIRYEHHPQQELQQQHNTQHHQHMHPQEYNQSLQQSSEKTQQSTEDDWGWGNDDWQVNGQTSERHQENIHQLTSQKPADSQQNLQLTHSSDELALPGEAESGNHSQKSVLPQRTVSRDSPGDGWPDWEAEQLQVPEVVSKLVQQNQVSEEKTTDDSAEKNSTSLQIDEKQGAQSQQLQQWDDGLGHNEFSKCVEDVCAPVSDGYTALQDSGTLPASVSRSNSLSPNNTGLHNINNDSWGQKSNGTSIVQDITGDYVGNEEHQLHFSEKQNVLMQQTQVPSNNTTVSNAPFSPSESCKSQSDVMETAVLDEPPTPVMLNNLDDRWGDGWGERETPQNPEAVDKVDEQNVQKSEDYPDSEQVQLHKGTLQFAEFQLSDNKIDTSVTPVLCNSELYPQDINKHQPREFQAGENKPSEQQEFIDDEYSSRDMTKSEGWDGEWDQEFVITKSMESTQQATVTESCIHEIPKYNVEIASKTLDTLTLLDNPEDVKESHGYPEESFALKYPAQMSQHHHLSHQAQESQLCSTSEEISILDSKSQFQPRAEASSQNYQLGHESFGDLQTAQESCNQIESAAQQGTQFHYNSHQRSEELVHQYEPQNCQLKQIYEPQTTYTSEPESRPLLLSEPKQSYQDSQFQPSTTDQPLNQCEAHLPTESSRSYQQYQEVNREIMPAPPVPDPIFSRIPDGASSIPEAPTGIAGVAEDGSNQVLEDVHQPLVKNTSQEVSERPSSSHSVSSPSHPVRPSSSHTLPDRPASNQSAHSVHSTHSAWSSQSAHSTHSVLSQNQEVPLDENSKVHVHQSPINLATQGKESAIEVPTNTASSVDGDTDPTVLPANNPEGPPPVSGPLGVVPSLRARKGSPFQPPTTKLSSPGSFSVQTYQPEVFSPPQTATSNISSVPLPVCPDVGANLETPPDNNEQPSAPQKSGVPLWSSSENVSVGVKLVVAAPMIDTLAPVQPPLSSNAIPLVVPTMIKEEKTETDSCINNQQATIVNPEPPAAHSANSQALVVKPKIQSLSSMPVNPTSPAVLDLSRSSRSKVESRGDGSQDITNTPNFSRMVPGESSKGESTSVSTYQAPSVVPSMPSERVVTGNDNPQPVLPVRIKQEPSEIRSPPDGPYTSDLSSQGASVVPPVRSETIGSEEPTSRNFASANSGSRSDLASDHRVERSGRWERDHSRDGESRSSDRYHDRSREHSRDYYRDRDDSPHSRHSYDRDYDRKYVDDRRRWRRESDDEEDGDRRYYESRDRRERAYRDELDRYSDRPIKEDKDRLHSRDKRRNYGDRSKEYYRSYDEDPYYGRGDRSQPVSRSSSINNLDNDGERSVHSHRSRHDCYDRHDRRDSHSRDSDPRDRDVPYTRDGRERDFLQRGWEPRESRDRRDPRYYNQRGGYQEAYGSREMYDQYQYYYHYYRDHPYYKEYYRQWMKQYGQAYPSESFYDDRTSIHSGRSSVNDELKKSVSSPRAAYDPYGYYYGHMSQPPYNSSQFTQDFHGRSSVGAYEPSFIYPEGSFSQLKSYASGELSGVPSVADDTTSEAPQRMTPVQFGRPHINAQFTFGGQLALVLPKDPRDGEKALVQLRDVQKMLCMDPGMNRTIQQMKNYPGPLTLSDTHKDVVVKYCEQQVAEAARNLSLPDKESVMLTWEYLALLVKQNGKLYGSDVAGLLLKGREVTAQPQHNNTHVQPENLAPENLASEAGPQDEGTDVQSQAVISTPERDEALLVKKFTEYLCLGRKREAVDYAVQEGLWGHALALSYKMDTTTHTRVLAAFSSSIPSTDVLLTLFQQLSGKRPEITKTYTPLQWGDWRQHLAVMISNPTGHTQRDRASIVTLGDTLATQGQLYAAHFCYLMAEVEWGSYSSKDSKLVLIGASHQLPFQAFATNEAIQCTEVYEFARSLDSSNPLLETFQPYKLVYALRLTEYGFPTEALRYCEVISQLVSKTPASHQTDFLSQVYDLASRLKYHDLHYQMCQGEVSEMPDPQWLTNLKSVINLSKAHISQTATEQDNPQTLQDHQVVQDSGLQLADTTDHNQQVPYSSSGVYPSSFTNSDKSYHHNIDNTSGNSYSQEQDIGRDAFVGQAPPANAVDGVHQNMYASNHLLDSQSPVERVDAQLPSEAGQPSDMVNPSKENASLGEVSMMQPPPQDQMQYMYSGGYLSGYPEQEPIASLYMQRSSLEVTHGSLPPSSDVSGEQRPGSVTLSQPSSLSNYQSYQTWEQHQQVNTDAPGHMPPRSPEPTESELSAHSQRTPEEEAYWAEMSGKKDEECDEFGGDVYEYEDGEEIGSGEPDFEASFQLRYRHQASLVSIGDTADITSTVPSSPPSPLSSPSPQPSHSPASNECEKPLVKGFLPLACPMGPAASTPLFQPPTHPSSQMSSPPPPLLGPNSHMTQSMNSATDTSSKDKSVEGKVMDKDLDKSQDKSGGWSITSLFGWKKSKQAVLPDDKNPTIIWDEEKKKWVNQDGDEEVTSPPPPPPKSVLGGPGTSPHMMTRGGPRKSRYVNTEKDAQGMAGGMPSNLPNPMLLPVPGAPMNINSPSASQPLMVPAPLPPPKEDRDATGSIPQPPHNVGYQEHHQLPLPQTSPGPAPLPEIVQGTLSEGTEGNGSVPMMGQPIGQPQFFNPTQFKTSTNANPSQTRRPGPGRRSLPARR
ncbi:uncharacterized protein LOC121875530 isoform X3 [Homarus americanus]|uniref:uncharacterized protein LOC121875530 isoform X3 n=1 Tax=Homarus americanus TaxID=6706 RepID=UPI001C477D84|nr:uncharacterized protein LOC121875530 isoform X3 [Homarus americanus]